MRERRLHLVFSQDAADLGVAAVGLDNLHLDGEGVARGRAGQLAAVLPLVGVVVDAREDGVAVYPPMYSDAPCPRTSTRLDPASILRSTARFLRSSVSKR